MNLREHIGVTAAEEACEVGQRITKALRFGFFEVQPGQTLDNAARIMDEFYQLAACLRLLMADGVLPDMPLEPTTEQVAAKADRIMRFIEIGRANGVFQDEPDGVQPVAMSVRIHGLEDAEPGFPFTVDDLRMPQ